jgi:ribosomal protein L40E
MRTMLTTLIISALLTSTASSQDYFPLREGNQWAYTMSNDMAMTMKVTGFADVGGTRCAIVESNVGGQVNKGYYAADSQGLKDYMLEISGQEFKYDPPILRIKLPFEKGQSWTSTFSQFGMLMTTRFESVGTEQVQTQAGNFQCIVIRSSISIPGQDSMVSDSYYADGQGLVRQKIQTGDQKYDVTLTSTNVQPTQPQGQSVEPAPPQPRPLLGTQLHCPKCNALVDSNAKFCPECGTKIVRPEAPTVCPKCGAKLPAGAKFCPACGEKIATTPVSAQTESIAGTQPVFEKYLSPIGTIMLYKPRDWYVIEQNLGERGYAVTITDPQETAIVLFMTLPVNEQITDSVILASMCVTEFQSEITDFHAKNINSTPGKDRTIMDITFTEEGEKGFGHGYFFYTQRVGTVYFLLSHEHEWNQLRPMLTNIAANIAYTPDGIMTVTKQGMDLASQTTTAQGRVLSPAAMLQQAKNRPGKQVPLQPAALTDRSLALQIPQGWSIEGQELKYLLYDNPQKRSCGMTSVSYSIIPTQISVPGVINAPYQPPPQALNLIFQFTQSGTNLEILGEIPGEQVLPEIAAAVQNLRMQGLQVDSRLIHAKFKSASGATLRGLFSVQCTAMPMSPVWQVSIDGSWAPENEFDDWLPLYLRIGETFQVNQQWAQADMQNRNSRQRQLNRNLQNSIAGANQAFDQYMDSIQNADRSRDYSSWMQSQTTLGQGTWLAENEGAQVYRTDSFGIEGQEGRIDSPTYNTTNFTGENPWGGNQLELVDTRAEYEKYMNN